MRRNRWRCSPDSSYKWPLPDLFENQLNIAVKTVVAKLHVVVDSPAGTEEASHDTWLTKVTPRFSALEAQVTVILSVAMRRCCYRFSRELYVCTNRWAGFNFVVLLGSKYTRYKTLVNITHLNVWASTNEGLFNLWVWVMSMRYNASLLSIRTK